MGSMAVAEIKITLPWTVSTVRGPQSVNTLHVDFGATPITSGTLADVFSAVEDLYATGLDGIWSSLLTGEVLVSAYNLSDATPRVPVLEAEYALTPSATGGTPTEIAVNVAFRANYASGVSKRKFRGRIYLGPLSIDPAIWTTDGHLSTATTQQIADAFEAFGTAVAQGGTLNWACGSEAEGWKDVQRIEVKNELATLRSRQNSVTLVETRTL